MSIHIDSDQLPAGDRFDYWHETMSRVRKAPVELDSADRDCFRFSMRYSDLGATRVAQYTATPYRVWRTPRMIRQSDPERLALGMLLSGQAILSQVGRQAYVSTATVTLYHSSHPYDIDIRPPGEASAAQGLVLDFPRSLLPLPGDKLEQVIATPMRADPGIGALTHGMLVALASGMDHYTPAEAARLSTAALEVLGARLAHELDADRWVRPETHRRVLLTRIHAFIQQHAGDPELSPAMIAAAHHISLRLLHKLFQEQGDTVAGWIRTRRLEAARRDLTDPAQAALPVAALAARRGFRSVAHFNRAFRAAYGVPPHQYRLMHLADFGGPPE